MPILPPIWFFLTMIAMIVLHLTMPVWQLLSSAWSLAGVVILAAGIGLTLWAADLFGRAGTPIKPFEASTILVRTGPYRFTRNPMYLGMTFALTGVAILLGSFTPFLVIPLFAGWLDFRFVNREEPMLADTFGEEYERFKREVRRWI